MTVAEGIRGSTCNGAYLTFAEKSNGTLEVGRRADMIVIAEDILTIAPDCIKDVAVEKNFLGGKRVHPRKAAASSC